MYNRYQKLPIDIDLDLIRDTKVGTYDKILGLCLGWNVRLIVSLPRHIAILRQE